MKSKNLNNRSLIRATFLVVLFFSILTAFQNCNNTSFRSTSEESKAESADNNGAGYGGKPKDYARFTPGFTCENKVSAVANIAVSKNLITITENKRDMCSAVQKNLDLSQIESSIYQEEIIGYQEGIFEGVASPSAPMPAALVEVWCLDTNDQTGIETIMHFDRVSNKAVNRIYFAASDTSGALTNQMINDFPVARVVSVSKVSISDGHGFNLDVYRNQPAPMRAGLFIGQLNAVINGTSYSRQTFCRLGGSLDAKVWPVKQIVDLNISAFKETPDLTYFSFSSDTGVSKAPAENLFISKIDGTNISKVSSELSTANLSFQFSPDSKNLYYPTGFSTTPVLMRAAVDGSSNTPLAASDPNVKFKISKDGGSLAYSAYIGVGVGLKAASTTGAGNFILSPTVAPGTMGVSVFDLTDNRVIFLCCNRPTQIYSSNFDGTDLKMITTPALPANWDFATNNLAVLHQQKAVSVWAWSWVGSAPSANYIVAIDGSWSQKLPEGWLWVSTSPDDLFGFLVNQKDSALQAVINLKTGQVVNLPSLALPTNANLTRDGNQVIDSTFFTDDSKYFIGLKNEATLKAKQAVIVSLIDGSESNLCFGVNALSINELSDGSILIYGIDSKKKVLSAYLKRRGQSCQQVNSVPLAVSTIDSVEVTVSKDLNNSLLNIKALDLNGVNINTLIYIPLNGKPSYTINSPVYSAAKIQKAIFLNDSKTVLYIGNQIRQDEQNAFLWSAK